MKAEGRRQKAEPVNAAAAGYWRYVGDGTRIRGVPARTLSPSESALFDAAIRQVADTGTVLYVWTTKDERPTTNDVVVAVVEEPVYEATTTAEVLDGERPVWEPGGTETKETNAEGGMQNAE